jgi:hypothetical protein
MLLRLSESPPDDRRALRYTKVRVVPTTRGYATIRATAATQAFDEALTKKAVIAIVQGFIIDDPSRGLP